MNRISRIMYFAAVCLSVLSSCEQEKEDIGRSSGIRIGKITGAMPETKAVRTPASDTLCITSDGAYLSITEEHIFSKPETKASPGGVDFLKENGFNIDGVLEYGASENDKHFMVSADVRYFGDDNLWYIMANYGDRATYRWRNGLNHMFWAYTKNISPDFIAGENGKNTAALDYVCRGDEDILMAYAEKTWSEGDPTDLALTFKHALSAFVFESGGFTPYYKVPGYSEPQASHNGLSPRVSITGIQVVGLETSGHCLYDGSGFTWIPKGRKSSPEVSADDFLHKDYHLFAIPQEWSPWGFRVTFKDETSGVELLPRIFTQNQARALLAGVRYRTEISGKIVFPIPDVEIGGGRVELEGHKVDSYAFEGFSFDGINKIRITWNGTPDATSSGLRACIYLGDRNPQALGKNEGDLKGFLTNMEKDNFVYGYYIDGKGRHQVKGGTAEDGRSFSVIIDLTSDWVKYSADGGLDIHFAYTGANSSGGTGWTAENIRLEVVEYSDPY